MGEVSKPLSMKLSQGGGGRWQRREETTKLTGVLCRGIDPQVGKLLGSHMRSRREDFPLITHGHWRRTTNNRMTKCFGLEWFFRGLLAQPPGGKQGYLQLDQVNKRPVQPSLKCFQGWGLHYLSGQPVPLFHHL